MQGKTKMLKMSRKGSMNLLNLVINTVVLGIVVVVAFLIIHSLHTSINKNGEATNVANTAISNLKIGFNTIATNILIPVVLAGILITLVVRSFRFGGRREEARD